MMENIRNSYHTKIAIFLIVSLFTILAGCNSGIEIVSTEKPVMTDQQRNAVADNFSKQTNLNVLEFADTEEEKAFFFALQLYYAQEYYRAITEFMRFMSYFEDSKYIQLAYFMIGESFRASGDYTNAVFFYEQTKNSEVESKQAYDFRWLADFNITVCYILNEEYSKARIRMEKLVVKSESTSEDSQDLEYFNDFLQLILLVADKDYVNAAKVFERIDKTKLKEFTGVEIDESDVLKFDDLASRNVGLSVIMSTLVPGLGQLYADRPLEALTSFLLTGIFTFIAYEAFSENQEVLGAVSSFLAASFYFANIYNSANAAVSFNENKRIEFYNRLLNKLDSDVLHFFIMPEETDKGIVLRFKVLR